LKNAAPIKTADETILVLAAAGNDGPLTTAVLAEAGLQAVTCVDLPDLVHRIEHKEVGAVLIAEEALFSSIPDLLLGALGRQPPWSDLPVIVITTSGKATPESIQLFRTFRRNSNVTLLERPFRTLTLTSALEGVLRARRRQYEIRDLLKVQEKLFLESSKQLANLKKSREELRQALAREESGAQELRTVMGSVPAAVWVSHDPDCHTVTGNPYACQLLRVPEGKSVSLTSEDHESGGRFRVFKNGREMQSGDLPMRRAAATGQPVWSEEMDFVFDDGSATTILINAVPLMDAEGHVTGSIGTALDITERKKMIRELQEREANLQFVLQAGQLGTWELNLSTQEVEISSQFKALFGFPEDAKITTVPQMRSPVHPDDKARVEATVNKALAEKGRYVCEYRVIWPDNSIHWVLSRGEVRAGGPDRPPVMAGVVADITARKQAEESLATQNASLEAEVEARTAKLRETIEELEGFSYSITHDLRAPLRAMQTFSAILDEEAGPQLTATSRDYLRRIMNASQRMDHLIRDVLAYSRVLRTELRLYPMNLPALIEGIVQSYPNLQPDKAEVRIEGEFCTVLGNEAALTQCVSNLLTNAAKFVAPGTFPRIRVWAEPRGDRVRVWFEDNGIGIDPQYKDRIFSLFQRLNKEYDGTGLGLSIVRKAIERMGGTVGVESERGLGSRFWLELECVPG
jgi:PAS domain S-box-containing protein